MNEHPNILLITTDQQRFDTIAALGNNDILTPHLDWLVDEGVTFTRAYSDCPICMAARATIMTGISGTHSGLVGNNESITPMRNYPTLPGLLTQAGYQTRAQGKMHFHPMRANYGFEHMELPMDYYRERQSRAHEGLPKEHGVGENEMSPVISTVDEKQSLTHWTVKRSIDFLETRDTSRPFFLWTSFTKPHPPWDPCANYWALYQNMDIADPVYGDWSETIESIPQAYMASTYCLNNAYRMPLKQLHNSKRAYYACITQIDYELGLLFARLREMNLFHNTWIIFTTDHGEMLGDHHMGAKSNFFEGAAHIPLIIRPPADSWDDKEFANLKVNSLVSLADILPTVLKIAGIDAPENLDGADLMSFIQCPHNRDFLGNYGNHSFCLMRDNLKYMWIQGDGAELLFDLSADPMERHNLAQNPEYAEVLGKMKADLIVKLTETNNPCVVDGNLVIKPAIKGPHDVAKWPGFHSTVVNTDVLH